MAEFTPGPWKLCQHLKGVEQDAACKCGYRGVIYGPDHNVAYAICQPGHEPAPEGQEGSEPARYPREVEIANAHLIAAAPELYEALDEACRIIGDATENGYYVGEAVMPWLLAALAKARGDA